MDDLDQSITYKFPCSRWLATDEDDGQIYRDLLVGKGAVDINKGKVCSFLSLSFAIGRLRSPDSLKTNFMCNHYTYSKVPKFSDARKLCCNLPKIQTKRPNLRILC